MTVPSIAAWALGRLPVLSPVHARDAGARSILGRIGWVAPAGGILAALSAAAGALFRDQPSTASALLVAGAVAMVALLIWASVRSSRRSLNAALAERESLRTELVAARKAQAELRSLASHDDLTGLPNRSLLYDRLGLAIAHARRQASHIAVLFLDLDDFKAVNDSLGHGSGDRLLAQFAARVRRSVRAGDTVARLGGDEFIVLLDGVTGGEDAGRVAAKVLEAVGLPYLLDGHEVRVGTSAGVSLYPADGTSPDALVRMADAAMYRDKQGAERPARPVNPRGHPEGRKLQ